MDAEDRKSVTAAADAIDRLLRIAPLIQGESRSGSTRIIIVAPLAAVYDVHETDRRVEILALRDTSKRH